MRYTLLGNSGLRVSELCLGTMTFGKDWDWGADKDESRKMFDRFAEAGGNFIDTASLYTEGTSEKYVGEFVNSDRDYFAVATKYTLRARGDSQTDPNRGGNQRKNMMRTVEESLERLDLDFIDLLWVHAWDGLTPTEEVMRGLNDLVSAGLVHYIGVSDTPAWVVAQANTLAESRGWAKFCALQVQYSLARRDIERELLPMANAFNLAVTPWGILASGVLTGKYRDKDAVKRLAKADDKVLAVGDAVVAMAKKLGITPSQVAIAWVRQQQTRAAIIPILGARSLAQLEDNLKSLDVRLSDEHVAELNDVSKIELGAPHNFLEDGYPRRLIFGETYDQIDRPR